MLAVHHHAKHRRPLPLYHWSRRAILATILAMVAVSTLLAQSTPTLAATPPELRGVVLGASGAPDAGVSVETQTGPGNITRLTTTTGLDGSYSLPVYPNDTYNVRYFGASAIGAVGVIESLTTPNEGVITENVKFPATGTVTVAVQDANGAPVAGASVGSTYEPQREGETEEGTQIRLESVLNPEGCTTGAGGTCEFEGMTELGFSFSVKPPFGLEANTSAATLVGGHTVTIKLPYYA